MTASICAGRSPSVPDPRALAARCGVAVELADLGDWWPATLVSEYDPNGPTIRVNTRALARYRAAWSAAREADAQAFIDFAVAHELYHHHEARGAIARRASRALREAAADAFARAHVALDATLDAFFSAGS